MKNTRKKVKLVKQFQLKTYGLLSSHLKLKPEPLICFSKTHAIESQINKILVPLNLPIYVLRLLNILPLMKLLSVT